MAGLAGESLPLPPGPVETPCFVVLEDAVRHNLQRTLALAGGAKRLMPHVKTHRAPWLVKMLIDSGVTAFKAATPAELEMVVAAGAQRAVWAYPTANAKAIARVAHAARMHPAVQVEALVDSPEGAQAWTDELGRDPAHRVLLRVDLDPGLGRTGLPIGAAAHALARRLRGEGRFGGWHLYDGHINGADRTERRRRVNGLADQMRDFLSAARDAGSCGDLVAGGSYSFDLWPEDMARWVSPGSWTYSSAQHAEDLADAGWRIGAYVLSSVLSVRVDAATLDAGSKAISPDVPALQRFLGGGPIRFMKEEHAVVTAATFRVGQLVPLVPRHACTAAYLYDRALVRREDGKWEYRPQLGASR